MWLDDYRGHLVDWATQRWVQWTGRRVSLDQHRWLAGPVGKPSGVGAAFFETHVIESHLRIDRARPCGLVDDLGKLAGPLFDADAVAPPVSAFYEQTSEYDLDAWSDWCGPFRPFGGMLATLFSRRLQQLNVPLSGLDTSRGMASDVFSIVNAESNQVQFTAWVRRLLSTGHVIYVGAYSTCEVPGHRGPCVRVVFPLPNGNAIVVMRPVAHADGSLSLVSAGTGFGAPGFYFTVHGHDGRVWARYVRSMRETIKVYSRDDEVRADHVLTLWGITFLRLHYRMRRRKPSSIEQPNQRLQPAAEVRS